MNKIYVVNFKPIQDDGLLLYLHKGIDTAALIYDFLWHRNAQLLQWTDDPERSIYGHSRKRTLTPCNSLVKFSSRLVCTTVIIYDGI